MRSAENTHLVFARFKDFASHGTRWGTHDEAVLQRLRGGKFPNKNVCAILQEYRDRVAIMDDAVSFSLIDTLFLRTRQGAIASKQ